MAKFGFVVIVAVLHGRGMISMEEAMVAVPELLIGALFVAAFVKTPAPGGWPEA